MNKLIAILDYSNKQLLLVEVPSDMPIEEYLFSEEHLDLNENSSHWMEYDSVKETKL